MTTKLTINGDPFEVIWHYPWIGYVIIALFFYFFFRHAMLVLMIMDFFISWLRSFRWFPKQGKRLKTCIHWLIALGLFFGFIGFAAVMDWYTLIPQ